MMTMVRVVSRVLAGCVLVRQGNGGRRSSKGSLVEMASARCCSGWLIAVEVVVSSEGVCVLGFFDWIFYFLFLFLGTLSIYSELPPGIALC